MHALFDAEDDTFGGCDLGFGEYVNMGGDFAREGQRRGLTNADGCGSMFDGFEGVFDLEEAAFGGEGTVWD